MNLKQPPSFYSSGLVIETVILSEQITECGLENLLEIIYKFSFELHVFSYMIFQEWLNILESFVTMLYDF